MIRRTLILSATFTLFALSTAFTQVETLTLSKASEFKSYELDDLYAKYEVFSTDIDLLRNKLSENDLLDLSLELEDVGSLELELSPSYLISDQIQIAELGSSGRKEAQNITMPLALKGLSEYGETRITIGKDFLKGFVSTKHGNYYLESLPSLSDENKIVWVKETDMKAAANHGCANHKTIEQALVDPSEMRILGDCYQADMVIASDYLLYNEKGSVQSVVDNFIATMNNVAANYEYNSTNNFADGVEFNITEIVVSTCQECDPWNPTTNVFQVLSDFKSWANQGGFATDHHIGQFWTNRDFDGAYVGLADLGTNLFCTQGAYHVLQDYTNNTNFLRVMVAHEMGHNFGAGHASTTGFIMSPTLNNTSAWQGGTRTTISSVIANSGSSCFGSCGANPCGSVNDLEISNIDNTSFDVNWSGNTGDNYDVEIIEDESGIVIYSGNITTTSLNLSPVDYKICKTYLVNVIKNCTPGTSATSTTIFHSPMAQGCADFCPDSNVNWTSRTVSFNDESMNATSWSWDFGDGNTSAAQSPTHVYASPGAYDVQLTINSGSHSMMLDSAVLILPDMNLPYTLTDGGSFDNSIDNFAAEALNGTENLWQKGIATGELSSTDNVWKTNLGADVGQVDSESALYSPRFDFSVTDLYILEFELEMEAIFCNGPYALQLQYSTDQGTSWIRLGSQGDSGPNISGWYNRGPAASCGISDVIFADRTGWTFNGSMLSSYDVSFLSGNSDVIFRFLFDVYPNFSAGYNADGAMINNFRISGSGVVALDLLSFEGQHINNSNRLIWSVENMIDFNEFVIERSEDGSHFYNAGVVKGIQGKEAYHFDDDYLEAETYYYRLRMVDLDGSFEYSDVIKLQSELAKTGIEIYPNPNNGEILNIKTDQEYDDVQIFDALGKNIKRVVFSQQIEVSDLAPGTYYLKFVDKQGIEDVKKLIVF